MELIWGSFRAPFVRPALVLLVTHCMQEANSSKIPRWQADLMKAQVLPAAPVASVRYPLRSATLTPAAPQEKNKQSKKNVKNRNDLCEVLGRGC
jgi:hypothetical protein